MNEKIEKKSNISDDKTINTDKKQNAKAKKKQNSITDRSINANKE